MFHRAFGVPQGFEYLVKLILEIVSEYTVKCDQEFLLDSNSCGQKCWFWVFCFFFPRGIEVKGAINLSVLAHANGQEKAEGEAVAWECYASLPYSTISIRLTRRHLQNPVSFHGQLQLPKKSL